MGILLTILVSLTGLIVLVCIVSFFMKKEHYAQSEIIINAPSQKVFDYIKLLKNQETFNKGAMEDPNRIKTFKGVDGTVGHIYSWKGNKNAGEGEKEIKKIIEGQRIESEIRFVKPMKAVGYVVMDTTALPNGQTKVTWSNAGKLNYPLNIMVPMVEKQVVKGMAVSLAILKDILEK